MGEYLIVLGSFNIVRLLKDIAPQSHPRAACCSSASLTTIFALVIKI